MNLNTKIFTLINGLAYKNVVLDNIMVAFSKYVPIIFMVGLLITYLYGAVKQKEEARGIAVDTLMLTLINLFISFCVGSIYYEPRPFVTHKVNLLFSHIKDASFPSDHATGTMSIAVGINKYKRTYGIILIILSCIVGISRVYVGHHYPLDVIGAYALVFITNYLYSKIVKGRIRKLYIKIEEFLLGHMPIDKLFMNKGLDK